RKIIFGKICYSTCESKHQKRSNSYYLNRKNDLFGPLKKPTQCFCQIKHKGRCTNKNNVFTDMNFYGTINLFISKNGKRSTCLFKTGPEENNEKCQNEYD